LTEIGWDQYYLAEQKGWVLYLESVTDLLILRTFAEILNHPALEYLQQPFVSFVATNIPEKARAHFRGLFEAKADLVGIAIFDRLDKQLQENPPLVEVMWRRREMENYICSPEALKAFAGAGMSDDLFGVAEKASRGKAMQAAIKEIESARANLDQPRPWSPDIKASDEFLDILFKKFSKTLNLPLVLRKSDYYQLARFLPKDQIDPEIKEKLDAIVAVAKRAKPRGD
jgi:hypothetical protein